MPKLLPQTTLALLILLFTTAFGAEPETHSLYQVSTLQALMAGEYDGTVNLQQLLTKGNMGLGTFDKLDGEMIIWDGVIYQGRVDGKVYVVHSGTTPFANVATADAKEKIALAFSGGLEELKSELNRRFPEQNKPVLFCIEGNFTELAYRSVPAQTRPYPPLTEVVKKQAIFEEEVISGYIVGFRFPAYMSGLNVSGFHLHFLSTDKTKGGHLFGVESGKLQVQATTLDLIEIYLPDTLTAAKLHTIDAQKDVAAVEQLEK